MSSFPTRCRDFDCLSRAGSLVQGSTMTVIHFQGLPPLLRVRSALLIRVVCLVVQHGLLVGRPDLTKPWRVRQLSHHQTLSRRSRLLIPFLSG